MNVETVFFQNSEGIKLAGKLELPLNRKPHNFALFAHCFTCNKNLTAVRNIGRALTAAGFGVLRFDFTGLGESEGDFADSNFSGNVEDLVAAANFLKERYAAPTLMIGHSLGGAAVIFASREVESVAASVTIGAPSTTVHVKHLFKSSLAEIEEKGEALVNLSGRDFTIKKQFVEDLDKRSLPEVVKELRRPLLVLHSPQDTTVGIRNAEEIYLAARHPKSFVSLDGADHLLMNKEDSRYVGTVIAGWATRYLKIPEAKTLRTKHQVVADLLAEDGLTTQMRVGDHYLTADEPSEVGGSNFGPTPYGYVSAGLAACTAMTLRMYADRKGWDLQEVEVHVNYDKKYHDDCKDCESSSAKIDTFEREIRLEGNLDEGQRQRMMEIADKCPVHRTLHAEVRVISHLIS